MLDHGPTKPLCASNVVIAAAVGLGCLGGVADGQAEPTREDANAAMRAAWGKRDLVVHDPSRIIRQGDAYWLFGTGDGVASYRSPDMVRWERGPVVFPQPPQWITAVASGQKGHFWAPDILRQGGRYLLYYSVSTFGRNTSAIALATTESLDPADPAYRWVDEGIVIQSREADGFNAIDPAVFYDTDGRLWLVFGSFWNGIHLVELDPATGKRIAPDSPVHRLAWNQQIEAPFIIFHDGHYYLLVNWGYCCRGVHSTYEIRVGRSRQPTGPYMDRDGVDMRDGGGSLLLGSEGPFIGPGHPAVLEEGGQTWLSLHFYDGAREGLPTLAVRRLDWSDDDWPTLSR